MSDGLLAPGSLEVSSVRLRVGESTVCRTQMATGYPHEVGLGWLEPVVTHAGQLDLALHVEPVPPPVAAERLRRQRARLESTRRADLRSGRLGDPEVEAAADDAGDLALRVARGDARLFRVGLYATARGESDDAADAEAARIRALFSSLLIDAAPATFRAVQGWVATMPLGLDPLRVRRTFDTDALASSFPFASADLSSTGGVLYGINAHGRGLVFWDRFCQDNYNSVILARSGAGKSYLAKLEVLRSLYAGVEVAVVDPEDEYRRLAEAVGGSYLHLGAPGVRLNPFDLGPEPDALTRRALFVHSLVAVLLGAPPDASQRAALDRAVVAAYAARGITADPRTHTRPAPVLADLTAALDADGEPEASDLALRLAPFTVGTHRSLFDGPTTTTPTGHLVVFSLRDLPDETRAAGTMLALDAVWRRVSDPERRRRRLVVVDEAWLLMRDPEGARFLFRLAKSARKLWCGLAVATQDASDLLGSELGQAVVGNAATQVLLCQSAQAVPAVTSAFRLSEGEAAFLLGAERGEGILAAGGERVAFKVVASEAEARLVTSDPAELAEVDL